MRAKKTHPSLPFHLGSALKLPFFSAFISILASVFLIACLATSAFAVGSEGNEIVKIGVLAKRGVDQCLERWGPTAEYLSEKNEGHSFFIVPLGFDRTMEAVEKGEVDFVLANPAYYVEIERNFGANRIATLKNRIGEQAQTVFGGVIFRRKDRGGIRSFSDLKGKRFMAADEHSLGGWICVWRELEENDFDPYEDFSGLSFAGGHDEVVRAVRDGVADAGWRQDRNPGADGRRRGNQAGRFLRIPTHAARGIRGLSVSSFHAPVPRMAHGQASCHILRACREGRGGVVADAFRFCGRSRRKMRRMGPFP